MHEHGNMHIMLIAQYVLPAGAAVTAGHSCARSVCKA